MRRSTPFDTISLPTKLTIRSRDGSSERSAPAAPASPPQPAARRPDEAAARAPRGGGGARRAGGPRLTAPAGGVAALDPVGEGPKPRGGVVPRHEGIGVHPRRPEPGLLAHGVVGHDLP